MKIKNKKNIMMISIHGDPTAKIGSEEQGGQPIYIKDICRLLSTDYQIDIFTRKKINPKRKLWSYFQMLMLFE